MSQFAALIAQSEGNVLPFPPIVFAAIVFALFTFLGFVVFSFRDVANRHSNRTSGGAGHAHTDDANSASTSTEHD